MPTYRDDAGNPRNVVARAKRTGKFSGPVSPSVTPPSQFPDSPYGVLVFKLRELMIARGLVNHNKYPRAYYGQPSINHLVRTTGLPRAKCWQLINYPHTMTAITFQLIARICYALKCQPGDFLEWQQSLGSFDMAVTIAREKALSEKYLLGLTEGDGEDGDGGDGGGGR